MLRLLVFSLCVSPTLLNGLQNDLQNGFSSPGDGVMSWMFQQIGENQDVFLKELAKAVKAPDERESILSVRRRLTIARATETSQPDSSTNCVGCQLAFTILPFIFKTNGGIGLSFANVQGPISLICTIILAVVDSNNPYYGQTLCGSLVTNFGPHVEAIAKNLKLSAQDSCYTLLMCSNNVASLDIPALISRLISQESVQMQDQLAPTPFLTKPYFEKQTLLKIKRIKRQTQTLKVAHITDIHVDPLYKEGSYTDCGLPVCCRELPTNWPKGKGSAGPFGDYSCNPPERTTKLLLEKLKQLQPDIVLYAGDSPNSHLWAETLQGQLNCTKWVASQLKQYFPNAIGIYSTFGNHETYPTNMYHSGHPDTEKLNQEFFDVYKDISHFTSEQETTIKNAGYYSVLARQGLRILGINSLFGEKQNWYNVINRFEPEYGNMLDFTRITLQKAKASNEKVIIVGHHPIGENVRDFDDNITQIISDFGEVIILNVAGHYHLDEFRLFRNDSGAVFSTQFVGPSANTRTTVNPSFRLYHFDNSKLELVDYHQYYLDLKKQEPLVSLLYNAKKLYGMADFSPQSMLDFAVRMQNDDALFDSFNRNVKTGATTPSSCTGRCRIFILCGLVTSTRKHRDSCMANGITTLSARKVSVVISSAGELLPSLVCYLFAVSLLIAVYVH